MDLITNLLIAISLAQDSFAVSISSGLKLKEIKTFYILKLGLFFGFFQTLMPFLGWIAGSCVRGFVSRIDHWIAFILLTIIGTKMIFSSFKNKQDCNFDYMIKTSILFILSIATSIDAFVIGISFAFLNISIFLSLIIIGIITFIFSSLGVIIGNKFGFYIGKKSELIGGITLIIVGAKILIEHITS